MLTRTGAMVLAAAGFTALAAWRHMESLAQTYGVICGAGAHPHCPACPASLTMAGIGLGLLALGARHEAQPAQGGR